MTFFIAESDCHLTRTLVSAGVFTKSPFTLLDVGCSGGIAKEWRIFPNLVAHGFDAQQLEIARLQDAETSSSIYYHSAKVRLPPNHEFHSRRQAETEIFQNGMSWDRVSASMIDQVSRLRSPQSQSIGECLTDYSVTVDSFVKEKGLLNVDFIKTDTDGMDLEVIVSASKTIVESPVLGLQVEVIVNMDTGTTSNCLANVDRLLASLGFSLFDLRVARYSRKVLPAQFEYDIFAQTTIGQIFLADVLYLRDPVQPGFADRFGIWPTDKYFKLACLFELFNLSDCAAELLLSVLKGSSDTELREGLLDCLVPPLAGRQLSYREYLKAFREQNELFFAQTRR